MKKQMAGFCMILILVCCMSLVPVYAKADGYRLTIHHQYVGQALTGVSFQIYMTSDSKNEGWNDEFSGCGLDYMQLQKNTTGSEWNSAAKKLAGYVSEQNLKPLQTQKTAHNGSVSFTGLYEGIYLVIGDNLTQDGIQYSVSPFLIIMRENMESYTKVEMEEDRGDIGDLGDEGVTTEESNYEEEASSLLEQWNPAIESKTIQDTQSENGTLSDDTATKLPQTGQLWWPVPVMTACGILCFSFGWWNCYGRRKRRT